MIKIGVFDSGIGGLSVANAIKKARPYDEIIWLSDRQHIPYGNKSPEQMLAFALPILQKMVAQECQVIVIACNTVTTTIIGDLRQRIAVPIIGIEPMIKPAASRTKTGTIAVCATPATLASKRYRWLKQTYAKGIKVLEPDCREWAHMIEHNQINEEKIAKQINDLCDQNADVIVLGCTHYHWIQDVITHITAGRAAVIQPEEAIVRRLSSMLTKATTPAQPQ